MDFIRIFQGTQTLNLQWIWDVLPKLTVKYSNISASKLQKIKTKLLSTCDKYTEALVPYKHRKIVNVLSKRNGIVILKAEKGRGFVALDRENILRNV